MNTVSSTPSRLILKRVPPLRLQSPQLNPHLLLNHSSDIDLLNTRLDTLHEDLLVGDIFEVMRGDPTHLLIEGDLRAFDQLGAELKQGSISIEGDTGHFLGAGMLGGEITLRGNAADYAGAGMRGGTMCVHGTTGDYLAAPRRGDTTGMRGGTIEVLGSAGDFLAQRMRRGSIVVHGSIGSHCGQQMIAGTLIALSEIGPHAMKGMRRGTLLAPFQSPGNEQQQRFTHPDQGEYGFLSLLLKAWPHVKSKLEKITRNPIEVLRYCGDRTCHGQGEWLTYSAISH